MNHVCTTLGFLVLVLSAFGTGSSCLLSKCLEANKVEEEKKTTVVRPPTIGKRRVSIVQLRQEAFMDKSVGESWGYLNELEEYKNIFSREEINAADDLIRLGIRVIVKRSSEGALRIRYRGTVVLGAEAPKSEDDSFDELYVCKNVMGALDQAIDNVWNILRQNSLEHCSNMLDGFITNNKLLSSVLILKSQPRVAELLPLEVYSKYIFAVNNTQSVLKYFIFQSNPRLFMEKFLGVYKVDAGNRLSVLLKLLTDLKISDEKVREAFDFAVRYDDCPIPVLAAFVNSKRPLAVDQDNLERIVLAGPENAKDRVTLLKLSKDSNFHEKIVSKCFASGAYSLLIREILFDRELTSLLSADFARKLFNNFVYHDRVNALKFIMSTELMQKMKTETNKFGSVLAKSIDHVSFESFKALVRGKMVKTRAPIFSSQDIIKTAYMLIKKKIKPEFLEFLIRDRFIAPSQKVILERGESFSLLAAAVKEENYFFIGLLNSINWSRCEDVFAIEGIDETMKSLLVSKGADFNRKKQPLSTISSSPFDKSPLSNVSPVTLLSTPLKRPSDSIELVTNETTFATPEIKRPRLTAYSPIPREYYRNALEAQDENCLCLILNENEEFKRSHGYNQIIWDLYNAQIISPLNQILDNIPIDLITNIMREFAEQECEYVVEYLMLSGKFKLDYDWFEGKCLIAHLLKNRKAGFALYLIERFKYDLTSSREDALNNPEGDIILNAVWNMDLLERLLELGASPNVKFQYPKLNRIITLKEYAQLTNRQRLLQILEKYQAK